MLAQKTKMGSHLLASVLYLYFQDILKITCLTFREKMGILMVKLLSFYENEKILIKNLSNNRVFETKTLTFM